MGTQDGNWASGNDSWRERHVGQRLRGLQYLLDFLRWQVPLTPRFAQQSVKYLDFPSKRHSCQGGGSVIQLYGQSPLTGHCQCQLSLLQSA